ncbi:unconventional myosin-XVI [Elysia marginata]|uniref:Unconventional myosin-XVI n=1 Tax=Elysia marginata TaxID=1093978 RepID=A0AAV4IHG2_9GAST|nr:unconventional myosin-XVI [Elysia marginata]
MTKLLELLLQQGACTETKNCSGDRPIDIASSENIKQILLNCDHYKTERLHDAPSCPSDNAPSTANGSKQMEECLEGSKEHDGSADGSDEYLTFDDDISRNSIARRLVYVSDVWSSIKTIFTHSSIFGKLCH